MAIRNCKPIAPIGTCRACGSRFDQVLSRGCARAYCSDKCKATRPKTAITKLCDIEGCAKLARSNGAAWCEMHYGRNRKKGSPLAEVRDSGPFDSCQYCGQDSQGRQYCGQRCSSRGNRGTPRFRRCEVCERQFEPTNCGRDPRCCSRECKTIIRQHYQDIRRFTSFLDAGGRRLRFKVFARDGWVCQLCGEPTDRKVKWPHPMYPTIDHIIPVSKGGTHEESNLQCAHAQCNATMPDLYALRAA